MLTFALAIPNYNQSYFLPWALESLRHQSVPFNVALMDGGSTDNFREVTENYSDIITCLRSGPDGGQAAAIKEGLELVSGEIVTWLNADDYYFPDTLDKISACGTIFRYRNLPEWRNWQTRCVQGAVSISSCGFDSHLRH